MVWVGAAAFSGCFAFGTKVKLLASWALKCKTFVIKHCCGKLDTLIIEHKTMVDSKSKEQTFEGSDSNLVFLV